MPFAARISPARAFVAASLVGVAITLTACVSDSAGQAFGPTPVPTTAPLPTVAPSPTVPPIPRNEPVAVVAGKTIPGSAYADMVAQQRQFYAFAAQQQPGATVPTEAQIRSIALTILVDNAVVGLYAHEHGITVTPSEVQARYHQFEVQYGGPITFTNTLKNYGYTVASFRTFLHDNMLEQKVAQRVAPLPTSVEEVRARHILVKTKALADQLYAQLKADPSKFAALAKRFSTDTGSAQTGGELGFFARGAMVPPFEQAAFSLPVGQIGKPVHSQFGWHIIQVEARKQVPYAQLDTTTQQNLQQRQRTAFGQWLRTERPHYGVRVLIKGVSLGT